MEIIFDKETEYEDKYFSNNTNLFDKKIDGSLEYKKKALETWVFTNIPNETFFVLTSNIPVIATFNSFINTNKVKRGVFIIETYRISKENFLQLDYMIYYIKSLLNDTMLKDDKILAVLQNMKESIDMVTIKDFNVRVMYAINETDLENGELVKIGNIKASTNIENILNSVNGLENKNKKLDGSINISITANDVSKRKHSIKIGNRIFELSNKIDRKDKAYIDATITDKDGFMHNIKLDIEDESLITHESSDKKSEPLHESLSDVTNTLNKVSNINESKVSWNESLIKHGISVNKLLSTISDLEKVNKSTDKESISFIKEAVKLAAGLV